MKHSKIRSGGKSIRREVLIALALIVLTVASGFVIQLLLQLQAMRRSEEQAGLLMIDTLEEFDSFIWNEHAAHAAAAERLKELPQQKKQRHDDLQLDLLTIVSSASPLKEGYVPELATVVEEYQLDARCAALCWDMMQDCRAENAGFPMICSAYRTQEFQQELFDNKVIRVMQEKYCSVEEATVLAAEEVAFPGTSEHQLGLAADIIDETYPYLTEWQETTGTQRWLKEHAADYGFILRYPPESSNITGIIYEPWHYRYVGEKFAHEITNRGITLEEYVAWRRGR
ncbi:MAG: M15 family metallopeptidase [Oscillospiraceae bacterium]|nr:M15 family metallopeptidase [Oscillospiraceae bacterium]